MCMCVHTYIHMYVCTYIHIYLCVLFVHAPIHLEVHIHWSVHRFIPVSPTCPSVHTRFLTAQPFICLPSVFPSLSSHNLPLTCSPTVLYQTSLHLSVHPLILPVALHSYSRLWSPSHKLPRCITVAVGKACLVCLHYGPGRPRNHSSTPGRGTRFIFLQSVQTGCKVHRTFRLMGTGEWGAPRGTNKAKA